MPLDRRLEHHTAALSLSRRGRLAACLGGLAYIGLPLARARRYGIPASDWWRIPVAVAVKDVAQLAGALRGSVDALKGVPQPTPHPPPSLDSTHR